MTPEELETYLSNVADELDGELVEQPGDDYFHVQVTRVEKDDEGVLQPVGDAR